MAGELTRAGAAGASQVLARFAAGWPAAEVPAAVRQEARRALVNFFATALAGCDDPALRVAGAVFAPLSAAGACTVIGRPARTDPLHAACLNAMAGNVHDFDDTHLPTIIHPTAPVAPALLALAQHRPRPVDGAAFLAALAVGAEIECRLGDAVSPGHYARGWHITATCGIFGAAAACGRLLGLDETGQRWALGAASAQSSGLVETLGSMAKSIGVGHAASNGLLSALLAERGFEGPAAPLEGPRGFLRVMGDASGTDTGAPQHALLDGLGERWSFLRNTYKPYPCGVVLNPVIEACLALHHEDGIRPAQVAQVTLRGHPLLRQRADRARPHSGREAQVSAQHAVSVALAHGRAGLDEFGDEAVQRGDGRLLADVLTFVDDESLAVESADVSLQLHDGRRLSRHVQAARGSLQRPLDDAALQAKLVELCRWGGSGVDPHALAAALWDIEQAPDVGAVVARAGAAP